MGLVGAGTNNARLVAMLRQLATYYQKDQVSLMLVRMAQGFTHMGTFEDLDWSLRNHRLYLKNLSDALVWMIPADELVSVDEMMMVEAGALNAWLFQHSRLFDVIISGKGTMTLNPFHSDRQLMSLASVAGLFSVCFAFLDASNSRFSRPNRIFLYNLCWNDDWLFQTFWEAVNTSCFTVWFCLCSRVCWLP